MDAETLHKIVEPYLFAVALMVAVLAGSVWLLKRDGDKRRSEPPPKGPDG